MDPVKGGPVPMAGVRLSDVQQGASHIVGWKEIWYRQKQRDQIRCYFRIIVPSYCGRK